MPVVQRRIHKKKLSWGRLKQARANRQYETKSHMSIRSTTRLNTSHVLYSSGASSKL